jgi:hypothetical protein
MNDTYKFLIAVCLVSGCALVPNEAYYAAEGSETTSVPPSETTGDGACMSDDDCEVDESCNDGNCEPALSDLGPTPEELCNGLDDDGDDHIDENYPELGESCVMGVGVCEVGGTLICSEDQLGTSCDAVPGEPTVEACNSLDDDCDDEVDEDFETLDDACVAGIGACQTAGVVVCTNDGQNTECDAVPGLPALEACNSLDDDCDGETDEGVTNSCGMCGADPVELCNGQDDDCDGLPDENFGNLGMLCSAGIGTCQTNGTFMCTNDGQGTICSAVPNVPGVESCNAQDDDCDGQTDEGVTNACGLCGPVPSEVCNGQDDNCDGQTDEGVTNACGECGPVPPEVCNGQDDNCDGQIDDGLACPFEDSFTPDPLIELCPIHDVGNKEFNGNGPEVTASVELYHSNTEVRANIDVVFEETGNGTSKGEIHEDHLLWTAPLGCTINEIVSPLLSTCHYIDDDHSPDLCEPPEQSGPVDHFMFRGDTDGDDLGDCIDDAYASVYFTSIVVELICP